jgi:hypothetical protein
MKEFFLRRGDFVDEISFIYFQQDITAPNPEPE